VGAARRELNTLMLEMLLRRIIQALKSRGYTSVHSFIFDAHRTVEIHTAFYSRTTGNSYIVKVTTL
jgi:hypothetical protein